LVDQEPVAGQPLPQGVPTVVLSAVSPIVVTGLTAGSHTIWIVLGNGNHVPFSPLVAKKLTVTVS
jgi:hypothetical protein